MDDNIDILIYTNWSVFEITATHQLSGITITQQAEYTGDNWGWQKDQVLDIMHERIKRYKRRA
jgi:hypothetical protein